MRDTIFEMNESLNPEEGNLIVRNTDIWGRGNFENSNGDLISSSLGMLPRNLDVEASGLAEEGDVVPTTGDDTTGDDTTVTIPTGDDTTGDDTNR